MVEQKALKKANDTSKRYLGNIADDYVFLENKSKNFLPKKERDSQPIKVIMIRAIKISSPGISIGK